MTLERDDSETEDAMSNDGVARSAEISFRWIAGFALRHWAIDSSPFLDVS
eukprot:CAMPEP_0183731756 /NCGR_PEP_ID=MMETSP0737-20130205/36363_1 /TAXON_ID=385413 /ORGANISM="Thalassiosira miniscula, Strain CCMP1093" /LENGTH=49 /DNA_ID= /DNA_START= /DNA_END= /DNA_ORIENTATION=